MEFTCSDQIRLHWNLENLQKCAHLQSAARFDFTGVHSGGGGAARVHRRRLLLRRHACIITQCTKTGKCACEQKVPPPIMLPHVWLWRHCHQRPKSSSTPLQHFPVFDFSQLEPSKASVIQSERKWHRSSSLWSIIPGRCNNRLREILSVPNGLCQRCSTFPFFF